MYRDDVETHLAAKLMDSGCSCGNQSIQPLLFGIIVPLLISLHLEQSFKTKPELIIMKNLLKIASVLWIIWGVFHFVGGVAFIYLFGTEHPEGFFSSIPQVVSFTMNGMDMRFPVIPTLKQHAFNLAWVGLVVTVGAVYVWRGNKTGIFTSIVVGGFADLGYFLYVDLPGFADAPGPQMTYIMATAIILSLITYFKTDRLKNLE